jgi:MoaA/NifB/PqqE/SkfB family radical SAM enzyme
MGITERIDNITGIKPEQAKAFAPAPKSVKIELTGRCNFRCAFCARAENLRQVGDMDRSLFERLLMEMREEGVEEIGLFYLGESFLCKWLPEAVRFAKHEAKFPYVFLTTNGSISTPQRMRECFEAGLDSLKFSLNYADQAQFSEVARVKPILFDKMVANIKAAKEVRDKVEADSGHRCGLYASYIQYDDAQSDKMAAMVAQIRPHVDEIYALPLYNQADLVSDADASWQYTAGNRGRLDALRDPIPCWSIFTEGHITFDGHLSACCFDHDGRFHMGDLNKLAFSDAWNSVSFQKLRQAHLNRDVSGTVCERCVAYA